MSKLRLYDYSASANCLKARILLAQLDRPYERVPIDIFDGDTLTGEYVGSTTARARRRCSRPSRGGSRESDAILWYLAEGTPFLPDDPLEQRRWFGRLIFEQTDLMPAIGVCGSAS